MGEPGGAPQGSRAWHLCYLLWLHTQIVVGGGRLTYFPQTAPRSHRLAMTSAQEILLFDEERAQRSRLVPAGQQDRRGAGDTGSQRPPPSHRQVPGRLSLFAAGSEVIKINTTGWFLTGREEQVTLWGHGGMGRVQGWTLGTGGRGGGWAPFAARVDEGLAGTPPPDARSRAASLRIWI